MEAGLGWDGIGLDWKGRGSIMEYNKGLLYLYTLLSLSLISLFSALSLIKYILRKQHFCSNDCKLLQIISASYCKFPSLDYCTRKLT